MINERVFIEVRDDCSSLQAQRAEIPAARERPATILEGVIRAVGEGETSDNSLMAKLK